MIYRRSSSVKSQESLHQFAINTSKGIDITKAIVDSDTVQHIENLDISPDGSAALRKRMLPLHRYGDDSTTNARRVIPLYDDIAVLQVSQSTAGSLVQIRNKATYDECTFTVKCSNYYTYEEVTCDDVTLDLDNATYFNTPTATVIGNCFVKGESLSGCGAIDPDLYEDVDGKWLPRYLKIEAVASEKSSYTITIVSPEVNTLEPSDSDIRLNPNMCLDYPYAIRDTYRTEVPQILGILPYKYKQVTYTEFAGSDNTYEIDMTDEILDALPDEPFSESKVSNILKANILNLSKEGYGNFLNNGGGVLGISGRTYYVVRAQTDTQDKNLYLGVMLNIPKLSYRRLNKLTMRFEIGRFTYSKTESTWKSSMSEVISSEELNVLDYPKTEDGACYKVALSVGDNIAPNKNNDNQRQYLILKSYSITYCLKNLDVADSDSFSVSDLTESVKPTSRAYSSISYFDTFNYGSVFLKAFCKMPKSSSFYAKWDYSLDGITWNPFGKFNLSDDKYSVQVRVPRDTLTTTTVDEKTPITYEYDLYAPLNVNGPTDLCKVTSETSRPDVFPLRMLAKLSDEFDILKVFLRFSIVTLYPLDNDVYAKYELGNTVSSQIYTLPGKNTTEFLETEFPNAVLGEKLYYNKAIYSYGSEDFSGFVYVSDTDSFVTPLYNVLEVSSDANPVVNAVIPWRGYTCVFTHTSVSLSERADDGHYTKTISSSVGVPSEDRHTACDAINGIIFKSGHRVYFGYPNAYSSVDTIFNFTDISKPVSHILNEIDLSVVCFSKIIQNAYWLMIPSEESTRCLKYDFDTRCWSLHVYPRVFSEFSKYKQVTTLIAYYDDNPHENAEIGTWEYLIDQDDYGSVAPHLNKYIPYAYEDCLKYVNDTVGTITSTPIHYVLDTGQKTDSVAHTKQFVESKIVFATLDEEDAFPLKVYVAIDGDSHVVTKDVTTDAPFWKGQNTDSRGVLNTSFRLGGEDTPVTSSLNVLRQLVIRYSGKGKSIRHLIEGDSVHNFKIYETYVRYKNLKA